MVAFFASMSMHLIIDINFVIQMGIKDAELYIIPVSRNANEMVEGAKKTGLFKSVTLLPDICVSHPVTASQMIKVAYRRFIVSKILKRKEYSAVYYNLDGLYANSIIYNALKKKNRGAKHIMLEHGHGPYMRSYDKKPWYLRLVIHMMGMACMDSRYVDAWYISRPNAMCVEQNGQILQMPAYDLTNVDFQKCIEEIFPITAPVKQLEGKKYVLLEQGPMGGDFNPADIMSEVVGLLDKDKTLLKIHPRQRRSAASLEGVEMWKDNAIPLEIIALQANLDDKVLFSICSASCLIPKLLFDMDPRVILLYKLIDSDIGFLGEKIFEFIEKVRFLYSDSSRFFIPESFEELRKYLEELPDN